MSVFHHSVITPPEEASEPDVKSCLMGGGGLEYPSFATSGNQRKWTVAFWCKANWSHMASSSSAQWLFSAQHTTTSYYTHVYLDWKGKINITNSYGGSENTTVRSASPIGDVANWYHIQIVWDTAQATDSNRVQLYVNGEQVTSLESAVYPAQDSDSTLMLTGTKHYIGKYGSLYPYNGYLSDFYFLDGEALGPSDFTQTRGGVLVPREYSMSGATGNSFHLNFEKEGNASSWLVQSDHPNNSTVFDDSSDIGAAITLSSGSAAPKHSTAFGNPFDWKDQDGRAIACNGVGAATVADMFKTDGSSTADGSTDWEIGNNDFTLEFWVKLDAITDQWQAVLGSTGYGSGVTDSWQIYANYGNIELWHKDGSSTTQVMDAGGALTAGEWSHICVTSEYQGGANNLDRETKLYINGTLKQTNGSDTKSYDDPNGIRIGNNDEGGGYPTDGEYYDVRLVVGSLIAPPSGGPSSKLSAVTGTKLLIQPEQDDSISTTGDISSFDKSGVSGRTITGQGNLNFTSDEWAALGLSKELDPFATKNSAILFDGDYDAFYVPRNVGTSMDIAMYDGDFTLDFWSMSMTHASYHTLFSVGYAHAGDFILQSNGADRKLYAYASGGYLCTESTGAYQDSWHYYVITRDGDTLSIYRDGTLTAQNTDISAYNFGSGSTAATTAKVQFGSSSTNHSSAYGFKGYLFDLRLRNGVVGSTSVPTARIGGGMLHNGADSSGLKNHWTTIDLNPKRSTMVDSPNTGKNYATLNYRSRANGYTYIGSLAYITDSTNAYGGTQSTIGITAGDGKFLAEFRAITSTTDWSVGINNGEHEEGAVGSQHGIGYTADGAITEAGTASQSSLATISDGDIVGIAIDLSGSTRSVQFYKNGAALGSAESIPAAWEHVHFACGSSASGLVWYANFGQNPYFHAANTSGGFSTTQTEFAYPVTGYKALSDENLPTPPIGSPSNYVDVLAYSGSGSKSFSGGGMQPDLCIFKDRTGTSSFKVVDSVRGVEKALEADSTDAEATESNGLTSFDSNGFTVGSDSAYSASGGMVAWCWKAGDTTHSNTSFNATSDFSIMKWTGNGTEEDGDDGYQDNDQDILHRLSGKPEFIMAADRTQNASANDSGVGGFYVWHKDLEYVTSSGDGSVISMASYFTEQECSGAGLYGLGGPFYGVDSTKIEFNNGEDDSDNLYMLNYGGNTDSMEMGMELDPDDYVAYAWKGVNGFSKFGTFLHHQRWVYLGFEPKILLVKASNSSRSWMLIDNTRGADSQGHTNLYNPRTNFLTLDDPVAESSLGDGVDGFEFTSNGFKAVGDNYMNSSSAHRYLYAAWAAKPFKNSRGVF